MVRPAETIHKELDTLRAAAAALAEEFSQIYTTYLTVLGHTLRRQVIMATYHLCTQVYPDEFLTLSVSDRAQLQKGMQTLGRKGQGWLQQLMESGPLLLEPSPPRRLGRDDLSRLEAALMALTRPKPEAAESDPSPDSSSAAEEPGPTAVPETQAPDGAKSPDGEPFTAAEPAEAMESAQAPEDSEGDSDLDPQQLMQSVVMAAMGGEPEADLADLGDRPFTGDLLTPTLVAKHHLIMEQRIRDVLQRVSRHANRLLRKAQILPDLPEALVEMASEADVGVPKGRAVPNVLNVMVAMAGEVAAEFGRQDADDRDADDVDDADDDETLEANMTHLAAIHLRLADLEFGDVQTALWRGKLRTAVAKLRKLGKQYQQTERELAIAQAEQAWRAVWCDDSSR